MTSEIDLTGPLGQAASTNGVLATMVTGARSLRGSNGMLCLICGFTASAPAAAMPSV